MTFFERTEEEIISNALEQLTRNTNINQLTPGGKTRALLEVVSREQAIQHDIFDENLLQVFIRYADDRFLDLFGELKDLPRFGPTFSSATDNNFMFYVDTGTFGDINQGSSITIPSGTLVSTVPLDSFVVTPGLQSQQVISYKTTQTVICASDESVAYIPIRAVIEGSASRVPRNVLNKHNFTNYVSSSSNLLKCTNRYSISNGEDRENKEAYRYRLLNINKARQESLPISVRLAALSVSGVANIKQVLCEQGCGSYSIYVRATTPTPSPSLLTEVSNAVNRVTSYGNRIFVLAPEPIGVELVCAVKWISTTTEDDINLGYTNIRQRVEDIFNSTEIGEEFNLQNLRDSIISSSSNIISIGFEKPNSFEQVYLYKRNPMNDGVIRNLYTGETITPLYNERVILETSTRTRGIQFITRQ